MSIQDINEVLSEAVERLGESFDKYLGDDLKLFIDSDSELYRSYTLPLHKNYVNKNAAGKFDRKLAAKGFMRLVDAGAQKYVKELGSKGEQWHVKFPKALRMYVAKELTDYFVDEMELGNYDNYLMKKYQKKR